MGHPIAAFAQFPTPFREKQDHTLKNLVVWIIEKQLNDATMDYPKMFRSPQLQQTQHSKSENPRRNNATSRPHAATPKTVEWETKSNTDVKLYLHRHKCGGPKLRLMILRHFLRMCWPSFCLQPVIQPEGCLHYTMTTGEERPLCPEISNEPRNGASPTKKKCASLIRRAWFSIASDCSEHFKRFLKVLVPLKSSNICSRSALVLVAKLESLSQTMRNHISHIVWNLNHNRTLGTSGFPPALAVCLFSLLVHSVDRKAQ